MSKKESNSTDSNLPVLKQCAKIMTQQRKDEVRMLIKAGCSFSTIEKDMCEKWGVEERLVRNYIAKVMHEITEISRMYNNEQRVSQRRLQLENLYETCMLAKDFKSAASAMDKLCRIDGVFAPDQVKHDVAHRLAALSPEAKDQRLKFLLKERQKYIDADYDEVISDDIKEEENETWGMD